MFTKIFRIVSLWLAVSLLIASCGPSQAGDTSAATGPQAWFDAPLPGTVFAPPNPCQIVMHGASPSGIVLFELSINGSSTSIPSPDTNSSLVTLSQDCGLNEPGEYLLEMRAQDNAGNWSNTAQTNLTIASDDLSDVTPEAVEEEATVTPEPELTSTPSGDAGISIENVSTNTVYIGASSCGMREVTFLVRASHPESIKVIVLFYRFQAGTTSEWQSVSMNSAGSDLYQQLVNVGGLFGNNVPFDQGTMQYQAVLQTDAGDTSTRTPIFSDITVLACGTVIDCSSYNSEAACTANGCNWVSIPAAIPLFACQNP